VRAATTRSAHARLGLLRDTAHVESLEARPDSRFRVRVTASGFDSEWSWRLEPVAGGTKVIHAATFEPFDRWTGILVRLGRASLASRVEAHLRRTARTAAPREAAEAVERFGEVEVDPAARTARLRGEEVPLTPKELDLLLALLRRNGVYVDAGLKRVALKPQPAPEPKRRDARQRVARIGERAADVVEAGLGGPVLRDLHVRVRLDALENAVGRHVLDDR
jgi:hypothetical protein